MTMTMMMTLQWIDNDDNEYDDDNELARFITMLGHLWQLTSHMAEHPEYLFDGNDDDDDNDDLSY